MLRLASQKLVGPTRTPAIGLRFWSTTWTRIVRAPESSNLTERESPGSRVWAFGVALRNRS